MATLVITLTDLKLVKGYLGGKSTKCGLTKDDVDDIFVELLNYGRDDEQSSDSLQQLAMNIAREKGLMDPDQWRFEWDESYGVPSWTIKPVVEDQPDTRPTG